MASSLLLHRSQLNCRRSPSLDILVSARGREVGCVAAVTTTHTAFGSVVQAPFPVSSTAHTHQSGSALLVCCATDCFNSSGLVRSDTTEKNERECCRRIHTLSLPRHICFHLTVYRMSHFAALVGSLCHEPGFGVINFISIIYSTPL